MKPLIKSIPVEELLMIKALVKEASFPKVEFCEDLELMRNEAELVRLGNLKRIWVWISGVV